VKSYVAVMKGRPRETTVKVLQELRPRASGKILIKPNVASHAKSNGENTDVRVVEGIVEYFQGQGELTIAEGCCGAEDLVPASTYELFEFLGYSKLEERYDVKLLDLNDGPFEEIRLYDRDFRVSKPALDTDYLISVPTLKTHQLTTISGCVKNLMGCLEPHPKPGHETATKWEIHEELLESDPAVDLQDFLLSLSKFEHRLIDLYKHLSPRLGVIDAYVGSEGESPIEGTPVLMGLILASENPISCDAVGAYLMGIDPEAVGHLKLAKEENLGEIDPHEIAANVDLGRYRRNFRLPSFIEYLHKNRASTLK
jgi:uncharacterized protein (DUF362 family)